MDAFGVLDEVLGDYKNFVTGFLDIKDDQIRAKVETEIADGLLWPEPWLALNPAFEPGSTVDDLVKQDVLHPQAGSIFSGITFHRHQTDAFTIANRRESYVLTTGTGSGKSMSYIVPIVDRVLRDGSGKGVRAIIVYPMNALANSQCKELERFLGETSPKVSFARYTGQEGRDEREQTLACPPDILLTNYVMLELMLTRPGERKALIDSAKNLSFLVLDELHTYRGRQGADVAMLVRRLRGAVGADALQCVGTSATLAGPGTRAEQRQQVAELATRIFGVEVPAANIVGESLRRATSGNADPAILSARLTQDTPTTWATLRVDPLAVWTEQRFGLHTDSEGNLARRRPTRLKDAAEKLNEDTGIDADICRAKLQELLLAGSRVRDAAGRTLFAFKLHQFIGKGDTVYTTLEPPEHRHLTTQYQRSAPNRPLGQPLFPLAFCRECGQDFLVVNKDRGGESFSPRILNSDLGQQPDAEGLRYVMDSPWPSAADPAVLALVPDDWVIGSGTGRTLDKARLNKLPDSLRVDAFGTITDDDLPVAFFERRAGQLTSTITTGEQELGTMTYGDTALIRRMNVGLRRRKDKDVRGHVLDTVEGRWCTEADLERNVHGEAPRYQRVIPYVEDHRNALLLQLDPSIPTEQRMAAMYALKRGVEAVHQLVSNELAVEALPSNTGDHAWAQLLFFEAAEGGFTSLPARRCVDI